MLIREKDVSEGAVDSGARKVLRDDIEGKEWGKLPKATNNPGINVSSARNAAAGARRTYLWLGEGELLATTAGKFASLNSRRR